MSGFDLIEFVSQLFRLSTEKKFLEESITSRLEKSPDADVTESMARLDLLEESLKIMKL